MSDSTRLIVVAGLGILLAFQWATRRDDRLTTQSDPLRLLSGDNLGQIAEGRLGAWLRKDCVAVYFIDPNCPGCLALADRWSSTLPERRAPALWIVEGSDDRALPFLSRFSISDQDVVRLAAVFSEDADLAVLGVHATPTVAYLQTDGELDRIRVQVAPLQKEDVVARCRPK